jgi:hypothetical protein
VAADSSNLEASSDSISNSTGGSSTASPTKQAAGGLKLAPQEEDLLVQEVTKSLQQCTGNLKACRQKLSCNAAAALHDSPEPLAAGPTSLLQPDATLLMQSLADFKTAGKAWQSGARWRPTHHPEGPEGNGWTALCSRFLYAMCFILWSSIMVVKNKLGVALCPYDTNPSPHVFQD